MSIMQHLIIHACGPEQVHALTGPQGQQARKLHWPAINECHACFVAARRGAAAKAAACDLAAVEHLGLPELTGSMRQVDWAITIHAGRLAAIPRSDVSDTACLSGVEDAKWWIDHRDETAEALLARAAALVRPQGQIGDPHGAMLCAA